MENKKEIKINIPYVRQETDYFCGPASLQMIFEYFGIKKTQEELALLMETKTEVGTEIMQMVEAVIKQGLNYHSRENSSLNDIESFIAKNIPVIVNFIEPTDNISHYAVIIGFADEEIIFNDPWNGENFRMKKEEFEKRWYESEGSDVQKKWLLAVFKERII